MKSDYVKYLEKFFSNFEQVSVEDKTKTEGVYIVKIQKEIRVKESDIKRWDEWGVLKNK